MRRRVHWVVPTIISIILLGWIATAEAQDRETMLRSARTLEAGGKYDEALRIYEQLYEQNPEQTDAFYGAQRILMRLRRFEELIALLRERIRTHPDEVDLQIQLGDVLYRMGKVKEAYAQWEAILERDPTQIQHYLTVARQYALHREFKRALDTYRRGRTLVGREIFAREMAGLYASEGDYQKATREYLIYLSGGSAQYALVRQALSGFSRDQKTVNIVLDVLRNAVAEDSTDVQRQRLLGDYYLMVGHPDLAFGQMLHLVKQLKAGEELLIEFAGEIVEAGYAEMGIQAYRTFMEEFPDSKQIHRALLGLANAQEHAGQYEQAMQTYRRLERSRYPRARSEALYRIGLIYLDVLKKPDKALPLFERLSRYPRTSPYVLKGFLKTAECFVVMGDLKRAKEVYEQIVRDKMGKEKRDEILFRAAEVAYLEGHFEEAVERCEALVKRFPKGKFVNDALMLITFIDEHRSSPEALEKFALSVLRGRQKKPEEALELLEQLRTDFPAPSFHDDVLLSIGRLKAEQGNVLGAIQTYRDLVAAHPDSRLAPEAQKRIGELYEERLKDMKQAMQAYEAVLTQYPDSVLADEVRRRLGELRKRVPTSETGKKG